MSPLINEQKHIPKNVIWFLLPAILIAAVIFPVGIQTNLTSDDLRAHEADAPGPDMQLNDISSGFSRKDARRYYSIFPSIAISTLYVPYIWLRGGGLPPYDLSEFTKNHLSLISELIILSRGVNIVAALGIAILGFFIIFMISKNLWASAFVSLSMALNPNLMFQSSVMYYENWALLWVFLSLYCYMKIWMNKGRLLAWIFAFSVCAALAVSTHDRMGGYYVFSFPALIFRIWNLNRTDPGGAKRTVYLLLFSGIVGALTFCLANNVFGAGLKPIFDYIVYKYSGGCIILDRMRSIWSFLRNQIGCHGHTLRLVFWNLGGVTLLVSCFGLWNIWKNRYYPGLILLLFPLGYQILSVGIPGWTAGRYILGQTLFATLFSGFGVTWILNSKRRLWRLIIIMALVVQFIITVLTKISDTYYNPLRVVEEVITGNTAYGPVNRVGLIGFTNLPGFTSFPFPKTWHKRPDVKFSNITDDKITVEDYDVIISRDATIARGHSKIKHKIVRTPPVWLVSLVKRWCYLYSEGPDTISIQYIQR